MGSAMLGNQALLTMKTFFAVVGVRGLFKRKEIPANHKPRSYHIYVLLGGQDGQLHLSAGSLWRRRRSRLLLR